MALNWGDNEYNAAKQWAVGRSGSEIMGKASELGMSPAELARVFNGPNADVATFQQQTGYGTDVGTRPDAAKFTFNGSTFDAPQNITQQLGMPSVNLQQYEKNPYLDQMAAGITQQATRNLNENMLPGIRSQSVASGGYGGSRQGIAEGLAMGRTNDALSNSLANLYGNDYQQQMNRNLQQYGMDQNYNLGMGGLGLQQQSINNQYQLGLGNLGVARQNADTSRYGIDQTYNLGLRNADNNRYATDKSHEVGMANAAASQANAAASQAAAQGRLALDSDKFGFESALTLQDREFLYGKYAMDAGNAMHNTPMSYWSHFNNAANATGQGFPTSTQSGGGNPLAGAAGGWVLGGNIANQFRGPSTAGGGGSGTMADLYRDGVF